MKVAELDIKYWVMQTIGRTTSSIVFWKSILYFMLESHIFRRSIAIGVRKKGDTTNIWAVCINGWLLGVSSVVNIGGSNKPGCFGS